ATEGWCVSNRGWQASVTFATLGSQQIKLFDVDYKNEIKQAKPGQTITIELKTALNQDWNKKEKGWVEIKSANGQATKIEVVETGANTGLYVANYKVPEMNKGSEIKISYGYLGLGVETGIIIK
ncbi:MAG TPA: hypothetical protein VK872_03200, partial [Draconibacterium sp.]|nr:hypothetical protein [Draconibacterium sp.]